MADPTAYTPGYSFTGFQGSAPDTPLPANHVDAELASIAAKILELVNAVKNVRRSDGALKNAIVTLDALSTDVLNAVSDWEPRGAWVTATAYAVKDFVSKDGAFYVCLVAHTSGTFSTDLAADKWMLVSALSSAASIVNTPAGNIAATTVQDAIDELDAEKQPLDAELTALAGLTSAADKVPYFTGSGTAALATLTASARTLLAGASMAAIMASLGCLPLAGGTLTGALTLSGSETLPAQAASRSYAASVAANSSAMSGAGGRLTLASGVRVTTSDQTAKTSVFYTPCVSDLLPLYDGAAWGVHQFSELTLALDSDSGHIGYQQAGKNFDVFVIDDVGTKRLCTGPAWSGDTTRNEDIALLNGRYTNASEIQLRYGTAVGSLITVGTGEALYVGTIRCTADGQTEDSAAKRFVWNMYNRVSRPMRVLEATNSWNYSTAAWQQANASTANQLAFVRGLDEDMVAAEAMASVSSNGATVRICLVGVGLDSVTAMSGRATRLDCTSAEVRSGVAKYEGFPGLGYHYLAWLEFGGGADTQTWLGDNGTTNYQTGIGGWVMA